MANTVSFPVTVGNYGAYEWLVSEPYLEDLLASCPDTIVGKHLAVTSFDSGIFHPTVEEIEAGWEMRNGIAYSPKLESVQSLDPGGWDEWFVFEHPTDLGGMAPRTSNPFTAPLERGEVHAFVNSNLNLRVDDGESGFASYFWKQFSWIQPRTYIAENDYILTFISADKELFARVCATLTALDTKTLT